MTRHKAQFADIRVFRGLTLAGVSLSLAACAVSAPVAVRSTTGETAITARAVDLALPSESDPAANRQFASALQSAFAAHSVSVDPAGALIADFAVSMGPADIGVQQPQDPAKRLESEGLWISPPRQSRRFDECEAQELRATLLMLDRATGNVAYRGQGTVVECAFDTSHFSDLAEGLVQDFVANTAR